MMKANSYMLIDMTVENLIKLSTEDLKKQIALTIIQDEDGCWEPFTDDILEREEDFVPDAVDDGLKTMDDLLDVIRQDCDEEVFAKFITLDLEHSTFENNPSEDREYIEVRFEFDFDWEAYRKYKAEHKEDSK